MNMRHTGSQHTEYGNLLLKVEYALAERLPWVHVVGRLGLEDHKAVLDDCRIEAERPDEVQYVLMVQFLEGGGELHRCFNLVLR